MTIHIGITGTRNGWTPSQREQVAKTFAAVYDDHGPDNVAFHHGDCVGVDEAAHHLAEEFGFWTFVHPPTNPQYRARCFGDYFRDPKPYLARNQDIVNEVSLLIVVPSGPEADNPRSGTWATYRMAVKAGVETVVIMP